MITVLDILKIDLIIDRGIDIYRIRRRYYLLRCTKTIIATLKTIIPLERPFQ
jgi:hypothetical protein